LPETGKNYLNTIFNNLSSIMYHHHSLALLKNKETTISEVVKKAIHERLLSNQTPAAIFFDLSKYQQKLSELSEAFPAPTLNAMAVKTNPLIKMLKVAAKMGFGAECASFSELIIAKKAGFRPESIVFDSPVKTEDEIRYALNEKIYINADNIQELELICRLIKNGQPYRKGFIGLRINPELPLNEYNKSFSEEEKRNITGMSSSKFGVLIEQAHQLLTQNREFSEVLTGLHVHIGSQKSPIKMLINGIKKVVKLAEYLNLHYNYQIRTFDIGGGLPVRYTDADGAISFKAFADLLYSEVPMLRNYKVITEFGRSVFANSGWAASKVEYTKTVRDEQDNEIKIALTHIGRNMFTRYHEIILLNPDGSTKKGHFIDQTIGGPLCFSGDLIGKNRSLPLIEPNDIIIIKDVGAYTFSEWSFNANRRFPPIFGYDEDLNISVLHKGQSTEEVASFWE